MEIVEELKYLGDETKIDYQEDLDLLGMLRTDKLLKESFEFCEK